MLNHFIDVKFISRGKIRSMEGNNKREIINLKSTDDLGFFATNQNVLVEISHDGIEDAEILDMIVMHNAFLRIIKEESYVSRGSMIYCSEGLRAMFLDCSKDHGIYVGANPVMACCDCTPYNIHNFGSCRCQGKEYKGQLPKTPDQWNDGQKAVRFFDSEEAHICIPVVDEDYGWRQIDNNLLTEVNIGEYSPLLKDKAVLVCLYGGIIYILDTTEKEEEEKSLVDWLVKVESPYKNEDFVWEKNNRIAINPHNANDGYVTVGYGHAIQTEEDALKYGLSTWEKQSITNVKKSIEEQKAKYGTGTSNPAVLTFDEAYELLERDVESKREQTYILLDSYGPNDESDWALTFEENELDAITSILFNSTGRTDPDTLLYYFLNHDAAGGLAILHKAEDKNWYGDNEGLLRRRLMEYNIFFNNDYEFYDSNRLEELKKDVGY